MLPQVSGLSGRMTISCVAIDSLWSCEASSFTLASSSLRGNCRSVVLHPALRAIAGHPAFHFTCTQPWSELSAWMTPRSEELENSHLSPETQLAASHADSRSAGRRSTCWRFALMRLEGLACVAHRPVTGTSPLSPPVGLAAAVVSPSQPLTVQRPSHSGKSRSHYSLANTFLYHNSACTRLQGPP